MEYPSKIPVIVEKAPSKNNTGEHEDDNDTGIDNPK